MKETTLSVYGMREYLYIYYDTKVFKYIYMSGVIDHSLMVKCIYFDQYAKLNNFDYIECLISFLMCHLTRKLACRNC